MNLVPGQVWWKVRCWLETRPLTGEWESQWFHNDLMMVVIAGPEVKYLVGLLPYGPADQNSTMN